MTTLTDILTEAKRRLGLVARRTVDDNLSPTDHDDVRLRGYATDGAVEIADRVAGLEAATSLPTAAGEGRYDLPESVGEVLRAVFTGASATTPTQLVHEEAHRVRQWVDTAGGSTGDPVYVGLFATHLYLSPVPSEAGTLRLYYRPTSIIGSHESGDEAPAEGLQEQLPARLRRPLVDYIVAQWLLDSGEQALAAPFLARYEDALRRLQTDPHAPRATTRQYRGL